MLCPICKAEYREGFTECSDCGVALVETLKDLYEEEPATPTAPAPVGVWCGTDSDIGLRLVSSLDHAGIPNRYSAVDETTLEIVVPQRAAKIAEEVIREQLASPAGDSHLSEEAGPLSRECPLCEDQPASGIRFCWNCGVPLVEVGDDDPAAIIWEGNHPGDAYLVYLAIQKRGIPYYLTGASDLGVPQFGLRRPLHESRFTLRVLREDEKAVSAVLGGLDFPERPEPEALPLEQMPPADSLPEEESQDIHWTAVWSGTKPEEMEALRVAFRENAIRARLEDGAGADARQLVVPPENEEQARHHPPDPRRRSPTGTALHRRVGPGVPLIMFCPLCQAEYRSDVVTCGDCNAALVGSLEGEAANQNPREVVWKHQDGGTWQDLAVALMEAGIPRHATRNAVLVFTSDGDRARALIASLLPQEAGTVPKQSSDSSAAWVCTLCEAGYRQSIESCRDCGAALVSAADRKESERRQRLVWRLDHSPGNRRAVEALRSAGIPARLKRANQHLLAALTLQRPVDEVWIFRQDMETAHGILTALSMAPEFEVEEIHSPVTQEKPVLHCRLCKSEYPPGYETCPGCGAALGAWDSPEIEPQEENPPELVWRGGDPVVFSCAVAALRDSSIPYQVRSTADHLAFGEAMLRPRHEIRVYRSDAERAQELLEEFSDPFPLVPQEPVVAEPEAEPRPLHIAVEGKAPSPALTTVRVFSSSDSTLVQKLREVLRDSDVTYWTTGEPPGEEAVYVHPRDEALARDMLRDMTQAPPFEAPTADSSQLAQRKSYLRWGVGSLFLSFVLFVWVARIGPLSWASFDEFLAQFRGLRLFTLILLLTATLVANLAAVGLLIASWARKADKIGLLSLFIALQGLLLLFQFAAFVTF